MHCRTRSTAASVWTRLPFGVALAVCSLLFSGAVYGQGPFVGPVPYLSQNDSPFANAIGAGTVRVETFEAAPPFPNAGTGDLPPGVMASAGTRLGPGGLTDSVDGDDGSIDGSGLGGHSFFSGSGVAGITFSFDEEILGALPMQVGVVWTDGNGTTLFEAFGPDGVPLGSIGPVAIADGSSSGTTGEDRFFGVSHTGGISAIRISNTAGGIEVDHLQYTFSGFSGPSAPQITNGPPPNGTLGSPYTFTYTATGAPTFSLSSGILPPGLTLSPAGVLSGTPTVAGIFSGTVTASNGIAPDATQPFSIMISSMSPPPPPNQGTEILVFGDFGGSRENLRDDLIELGNMVTLLPNLPEDLSPYRTIWHVSAFTPLTSAEQSRLAAFLAGGGGLHLTGERPCCEDQNDSLQAFLNMVVVGGGYTVGDQGDIGTPYPFNPAALGGITMTPNVLTNWVPSASGGMLGFDSGSDPNVFVTGAGGVVVGGVWGEEDLVGGNGRLTLLMDVNWLQQSARTEVIENIQAFLAGGSGMVTPPCELRCSAVVPASAAQGESVEFAGDLIIDPEACEEFPPIFQWSFGDGTTSNEQNPLKTYAEPGLYQWQLTIFSGDRSCSESGSIRILCDVSCSATVPSSAAQDEVVNFASSVDIGADCNLPPPTFFWEFGDGTTSTLQNPGKAYSTPGLYEWRVTVTTGRSTCTRSGTINVSAECALNCTATVVSSAVEDQVVSFSSAVGLNAACPSVQPATLWTFGDGTTSTEANPAKVYDEPGTYTWQLTTTLGMATCTRTGTVTITRAPAIVAVTQLPEGIVQPTEGGGTTTYTVQNVGGTFTQVTVTQMGDFFTQSPTSFLLEPGASQVVTVTGLPTEAGSFEGSIAFSGLGVPPDLTIPIRVVSTEPPDQMVTAIGEESRVDVPSEPGEMPDGTANFTNTGSETIQGVLSADVPWIIPQAGIITIEPGQTVTVSFTIDPSLRGDEEYGTAVGTLILTYLNGTAGKIDFHSSHGRATASVPIHHTASPGTQPGQIPPLQEGEVALFLPGIANVTGSVGPFLSDIGLTNLTGSRITGVDLFYKVLGSPMVNMSTLNQINPGQPLVLGDVAKSVFEADSTIGTLQIRTNNVESLAASARVLNTAGAAGTFGTAIPTFRSDRSAGAGESIFLTGLESNANVHTNLYVQEVTGNPITLTIDFYDAQGSPRGGRTESIEPFGLLQIGNAVPAGAVSAVVTALDDSAGRLVAYATPVDETSGDSWAVTEWRRQFGVLTGPSVIPVAASIEGADSSRFTTDVWILNTGNEAATGTLTFRPQSGEEISREISLGALESFVVRDVLANEFGLTEDALGYLVFTPESGSIVSTSRTYTERAGEAGTVGTSVPSIPVSAGLRLGEVRRFGAVDDASLESIMMDRAGTYRTNLGIVEVSGRPVVVRVSLTFKGGTQSAASTARATRTFEIGAGEFFQLNEISRAMLGAARDIRYKDLTNMQLDVQVVSGTGSIIPFISSLDNASGDSILRLE